MIVVLFKMVKGHLTWWSTWVIWQLRCTSTVPTTLTMMSKIGYMVGPDQYYRICLSYYCTTKCYMYIPGTEAPEDGLSNGLTSHNKLQTCESRALGIQLEHSNVLTLSRQKKSDVYISAEE